ncbi:MULTISPECIES: hypothetical protein [unclassified Leclercia]|uniref:Lipoprotein n=1 Tax=Leclercia barmai TaxID=2785629 RepID=A0ABS7RZ74_9ENTR|nr:MULTISPECIES: hypothetical protein [unclassified Leclercia]MBZ0059605.1 hypothetical protein [Leclercia sp. EMC7]MCM5697262.1 hypothetical protein [Leclercia sp. LTM01]MCM5702142.1 hypothetical protein [Leclercia sp. LTM14]
MKCKFAPLVAIVLLAGCTSSAERMYECEAQGVSRDACYVAEQNRKANINSAAEKQAMENASDLYGPKGTETYGKKQQQREHHQHRQANDDDNYDNDNDQW